MYWQATACATIHVLIAKWARFAARAPVLPSPGAYNCRTFMFNAAMRPR